MELTKVKIENFRSIEDVTIDLDPRCQILIGKNEVGKSNILAACALLDPAKKVLATDLREAREHEASITKGSVNFIFRLNASELASAKKIAAASVFGMDKEFSRLGGESYSFEQFIELLNEWLHIVKIPSGERSETYWSKDNHVVSDQWLAPTKSADLNYEVKVAGSGKSAISKISFIHSSLLDKSDLALFEAVSVRQVAYWVSKIAIDLTRDSVPRCLFWSYSESNLLPSHVDIEEFKSDPSCCEPLRALFLLAGERDPAAAIVSAQTKPHGLRNLLNRVAKKATTHISERWREVGTVEVVLSPNGAQIDASVKDHFNEFAFAKRSDGFKRFISFLILVAARNVSSDLGRVLFIQDEPDLGLHPSGVKSLLRELIALSSNNYVLVSTHSIFMVDHERIDRHQIVVKKEEATAVVSVDKSRLTDEEVLYNALGYSVFDLIRPVNFLFEGWRDKKLFEVSLKRRGGPEKYVKSRIGQELGLAHAMGVKDIGRESLHLDSIGRRIVAISDSDDVARQAQRAFLQDFDPERHVWKRYDELLGSDKVLTAEDFIEVKRLVSKLKIVLETNSFSSVGVDADAFADCEDGVVSCAKGLMTSAGVLQADLKKHLNSWKTMIFEDLKPEHVTKEFSKVVEALALQEGYESPGVGNE